jgi:predicted O-methyltransferase YrrM
MIKKVINKIRALIEIKKRKLGTKFVLQQLESNKDEVIKNFVGTLKFMRISKNWMDDEIASFNKVNEIRDGYLASSETVNITDYGAGSSSSKRTKEQMYEGVSSKVNISDVCRRASSPNKWGELIFKIIRDFKPENCLELGTCLGISGAYQISALKLNGHGKFTTIEGSEELAKYADSNLKKLNYQDYTVHIGRFIDVLPNILSKDHPIDFAFIDGHHDKMATQEYYELIYPFLSKKSIVIFDDINWSNGMKDVWQFIYKEGKGIKISFDLYKWGICVVDKDRKETEKYYYKVEF